MSRRKKLTTADLAEASAKGVAPTTKAMKEKAARAAAPKKKGRPKKFPHPGIAPDVAAVDEKEMRSRLFDADDSRAALRWKSRTSFATDVNQISVAQLAELPEFAAVGLAQLQKWCWVDGWHDERKRFLADLQKRMELAISDEVTRQRLRYLRALKPVLESALKKFEPHEFVQNPNDLGDDRCASCGRTRGFKHDDPFYGVDADKIVTSIVKLVEVDLSLSEVVARSVAGVAAAEEKKDDGRDGNPPLTGHVTSEEARVAAHAILRKRRAAIVVRRSDSAPDGDSDHGGSVDDAADGAG